MPKSKKVSIETGAQTRAALDKIRDKTDWTISRMARESGITREALRKVYEGTTKNPGVVIRTAVAKLLQRAEAMK